MFTVCSSPFLSLRSFHTRLNYVSGYLHNELREHFPRSLARRSEDGRKGEGSRGQEIGGGGTGGGKREEEEE